MKKLLTLVLLAVMAITMSASGNDSRECNNVEEPQTSGKVFMKVHRKIQVSTKAPGRHLPVDVSYNTDEGSVSFTTANSELNAHVYLINSNGDVVDESPVLTTSLQMPVVDKGTKFKVYIDGGTWYADGNFII